MKMVLLGLFASVQISAGVLNIGEEQAAARDLVKRVDQKALESHEIQAIHDQKQEALSAVNTSVEGIRNQIDEIKTRIGGQIDALIVHIEDYQSRAKIADQREKEEFETMLLPLKHELHAIRTSAPYQEKVGKLVQGLQEYNRSWMEQKSRYRGLWDGIDSFDVGIRIGIKEAAIRKAVLEFTGDIEAKIKEHEDHFRNTRKVYYSMIQRSTWKKIASLQDQRYALNMQIVEQTEPLEQAISQINKDMWGISKPFLDQMAAVRKAIEIQEIERGA